MSVTGIIRKALPFLAGFAAGWLASRISRSEGVVIISEDFKIRPELASGKHKVLDLEVCEVYLMDDTNYPCWLVLVPRINDTVEITELSTLASQKMWKEVQMATAVVQRLFTPSKINIATIGNIVSQLHIHITARMKDDVSWPGPCYGAVPAVPYSREEASSMVEKLRHAFQ